MEQVNALLRDLGLTNTERTVYVEGLLHASIDVHTLVTRTRIKRPTVYHALETLAQKGLVSKHGTARKLMFVMTPPDRLRRVVDESIERLEQRKKRIEELVPLLRERMPSTEANAINVMQFDGIDGVKTVVEEALYCKSRTWDILAPKKNFFSEFDKTYSRYFLTTRRARGITARSLWERGANEEDGKLSLEDVRARNPRYLPKALHGQFESVIILFDQKVAIISSLRSTSAILIDSAEVHRLMQTMFNGLWEISTPYAAIRDTAS